MDSTDVSFDDSKCPGLDDNKDGSETLNFENLSNLDDLEEDDESAQQKQSSEASEPTTNQESSEPVFIENSPVIGCSNTGGESHDSTSQDHNQSNSGTSSQANVQHSRKWDRDHTTDQIIGDPSDGVRTRRATMNECLYACFLSQNEPKEVEEALLDPDWIVAFAYIWGSWLEEDILTKVMLL